MCLRALDIKMFCQGGECWKAWAWVALSAALFQKYYRVFINLFLFKTSSGRRKGLLWELWFTFSDSAVQHQPCLGITVSAVVSLSELSVCKRRVFFSENRISDSASTCKQRKLCSAMITLMPFADHVFDASEVCSKNDFSFLLRPAHQYWDIFFFSDWSTAHPSSSLVNEYFCTGHSGATYQADKAQHCF